MIDYGRLAYTKLQDLEVEVNHLRSRMQSEITQTITTQLKPNIDLVTKTDFIEVGFEADVSTAVTFMVKLVITSSMSAVPKLIGKVNGIQLGQTSLQLAQGGMDVTISFACRACRKGANVFSLNLEFASGSFRVLSADISMTGRGIKRSSFVLNVVPYQNEHGLTVALGRENKIEFCHISSNCELVSPYITLNRSGKEFGCCGVLSNSNPITVFTFVQEGKLYAQTMAALTGVMGTATLIASGVVSHSLITCQAPRGAILGYIAAGKTYAVNLTGVSGTLSYSKPVVLEFSGTPTAIRLVERTSGFTVAIRCGGYWYIKEYTSTGYSKSNTRLIQGDCLRGSGGTVFIGTNEGVFQLVPPSTQLSLVSYCDEVIPTDSYRLERLGDQIQVFTAVV